MSSRPRSEGEDGAQAGSPPLKKARTSPGQRVAASPGGTIGSSSSGGSGAKQRPPAQAVTAAKHEIMKIAQSRASRGGVRMTDIQGEMASTPQNVMLEALNSLMSLGNLAPAGTVNGQPVFKLQSLEDAAKLRELTTEDRLVLQEVEKSGVGAISTKEL